LEKLGIPLTGEIEVWAVPGNISAHIYGGWYTAVGKVIKRPSREANGLTLGNWLMFFKAGASYPVIAFAGKEVFELQFVADVGNFIDPEESVTRAARAH
jgi:hypothetical protein